MGYELHITRRNEHFGDGPEILLSEWQAYVASCLDMRMDNYAEAKFSGGSILRHEKTGIAVWTAYSLNGVGENWAWFSHERGNISFKNPDAEILQRMLIMAEYFQARVQGDDCEFYKEVGDLYKTLEELGITRTSQ